jgi:transcriptional regulator EpsA
MPHPAYHVTDHGDALLQAVEAAGQVRSRQQLFLWLRLHLHRFVPHDVVLCLPGRSVGLVAARPQVFNSVPLSDTVAQGLNSADDGFWQALLLAWVQAGRQPLELALASLPACEVAQGLIDAGFAQLTVHGVDLASGVQPSLLLAFGQLAEGDASFRAAGLQLCLPQIYFAVLRAAQQESQLPMQAARQLASQSQEPLLTQRELEVLKAVRAARSNIKIGEQLGISPLTVKNHLRKIMRKLGAHNRVQAVAEAMTRRLIE